MSRNVIVIVGKVSANQALPLARSVLDEGLLPEFVHVSECTFDKFLGQLREFHANHETAPGDPLYGDDFTSFHQEAIKQAFKINTESVAYVLYDGIHDGWCLCCRPDPENPDNSSALHEILIGFYAADAGTQLAVRIDQSGQIYYSDTHGNKLAI